MPSKPVNVTSGAHYIQIVRQRHDADCAVAVIAMFAGVSYEEALLAIGTPAVLTSGVQLRVVRTACRRLKCPVVLRRHIDLISDTGILVISCDTWPLDHLVILKEGIIVDPDNTVWDVDTYLEVYRAKVSLLLRRKDS